MSVVISLRSDGDRPGDTPLEEPVDGNDAGDSFLRRSAGPSDVYRFDDPSDGFTSV